MKRLAVLILILAASWSGTAEAATQPRVICALQRLYFEGVTGYYPALPLTISAEAHVSQPVVLRAVYRLRVYGYARMRDRRVSLTTKGWRTADRRCFS